MFLIDTNVVSELRKSRNANSGVIAFFERAERENAPLFVSVITIGELRRGVALVDHRGDRQQARRLDVWLENIIRVYADNILDFTAVEAQVWGVLRVPGHENAIDKQIAATALVCDLVLVTRNVDDFKGLGVDVLNPFV
ncbi:MAG: type II toxin-antitoxin system VapC family toxin [Pseudomonadales bacterium]